MTINYEWLKEYKQWYLELGDGMVSVWVLIEEDIFKDKVKMFGYLRFMIKRLRRVACGEERWVDRYIVKRKLLKFFGSKPKAETEEFDGG